MAPVIDAIDVFEEEAKRILWLPPITLGYLFTLTGFQLQFGLAVASIGGARMFGDIVDAVGSEGNNEGGLWSNLEPFIEDLSLWKSWVFAVFAVIYAASAIYSPWVLYQQFVYSNPITVGLAGIYWGIGIVVFLNL